jgi:hypothetical protein
VARPKADSQRSSAGSIRAALSICGRPPRGRDFQRQQRKPALCQRTSVSGRMIVRTCRIDEPAIQLDKEPAIIVREPDAVTHPTPQDHQLLSKHRVLSLKPQLRLERRGQDGQSEIEQPNHSASLGDSITSSTQTRFFGTHTTTHIEAHRIGCEARLTGKLRNQHSSPCRRILRRQKG